MLYWLLLFTPVPKTLLQLTCVEKWAEGEGAVLLVKGEVEDVQVTDAHHLHGFLIPDATFITYECLEAFWGLIHIHAVRGMRWEAGAMFFFLPICSFLSHVKWPLVDCAPLLPEGGTSPALNTHNSVMKMSGSHRFLVATLIFEMPSHSSGFQLINGLSQT